MITKNYGTPAEILMNSVTAHTANCVIDSANVQVNSEGKKIIKAGTPVAGDKRFPLQLNQVLQPSSNPVGILFHDVDITNGKNNGVVILGGDIAFNNMDKDVQSLYSDDILGKLPNLFFYGGANE